jgi:LCP family protein required for cell wall assembly
MKSHKKPKSAPGPVISDVTTKYQVSRSLPDLRDGPSFDSRRGTKTTFTNQFGNRTQIGQMSSNPPKPNTEVLAPKKDKKPRSWKRRIKRFFLVLLLLVLLIGGWLGWKALRNSGKLGTNLWSIFDNSKLKGEADGHVNILLAGNSIDDPGHAGAQLTDSIMVLSINTRNNTAFMLSIPRDLYVSIPNNGYARINSAYVDGEAQKFSEAGYPNGGMGLLEKVVSQKLNMPIDYYALIDYTAFRDSVNAVGGVSITINSSSKYGVYDPYTNLNLPNGVAQLNGQMALNLARSRGDGPGAYGVTSDFDRAAYQRQILLALKGKASSAGVLTNPIKVGNLFDAAGNNIKTDLSLGNIKRLNAITKPIPDSSITSAGLTNSGTKPLLMAYTGTGGASVLVPSAGLNDYTQIQAYVVKLLGPSSSTPSK